MTERKCSAFVFFSENFGKIQGTHLEVFRLECPVAREIKVEGDNIQRRGDGLPIAGSADFALRRCALCRTLALVVQALTGGCSVGAVGEATTGGATRRHGVVLPPPAANKDIQTR